jgi:hypothetical protein
MNGRQVVSSNNRPTCKQPWCPMKQPKFAAKDVADLLLCHVSGDSARDPFSEENRITPGPFCRACIVNVIRGKNACRTEAEWRYLDEAGRWHYRRQRRSRVLGVRA